MALHNVPMTPEHAAPGLSSDEQTQKLHVGVLVLTLVGVWVVLILSVFEVPPLGSIPAEMWLGALMMIGGAVLWRRHRSVALGLLIGPPLGVVAVPALMMGGFFLFLFILSRFQPVNF